MLLRSLRIDHLRNCQRLDLRVEHSLLLISGPNGAGKTTLLEAIYLAARGRTFRARKVGPLITQGASSARIRAHIEPGDRRLEVRLTRSGTERLLDGIPWSSQHDRSPPLRIRLIGENAQHLLDGDPALRRVFLDWNLFHVEPPLARLRGELRRVLAQRNAALRTGSADAWIWDHPLVECSNRLDTLRKAFLTQWQAAFCQLAQEFPALSRYRPVLRRGWPEECSLEQTLADNRAAERARGYSLYGAHRADFTLVCEDRPARLSRGQTKVAVALLQLAAEAVHQQRGLPASLWLLDDLLAELDREGASRLLKAFSETGGQRILTLVSSRPDPTLISNLMNEPADVFHVEHGQLQALPELACGG